MKKLLLLTLLLVFFLGKIMGQNYTSTIISGINEIAGTGTAVTLTASASSSTSSGSLPIGFTFNFYGNAYTQFYINPTGTISFSSANQNFLESYYAPTNIIPSTNAPNNFIGFAFINPYDNYPSPNVYPDYSTATINYFVSGTAPNRILVVNFKDVKIPATYAFPNQFIRTQIQLYENDSKIEVHNTNSAATQDNGGINRVKYLQIGVENIDGTKGEAATCPERWNLDNKTVRFTYSTVNTNAPTSVTNSTTLCNGTIAQSVNLSATCATGTPVWYQVGASSCIIATATPLANTTVTPTVTTTYKVRCENSGSNSDFITTKLTVASKPNDPIFVTADQTSCYAGSNVDLSGACSSNYPKWYNAAGTLITSTNTFYNGNYYASTTVAPTATTSYNIRCENSAVPQCYSSKTVNVTVSPVSAPTNYTPSQNLCAGLSLNLQATCTAGTLEWNVYDGSNYVLLANTTISPTVTSYYRAYCKNGTCSLYQNVNITVTTLPSPPSTITKNPITDVYPYTSVILTASACSSGSTFKWEDNSTANPRTVAPSATTTYSVKCVSNTCESATSTSASVIVKTISISNTTPTVACETSGTVIPVTFTTTGSFTGNFTVKLFQTKAFGSYTSTSTITTASTATNNANIILPSNQEVTGNSGMGYIVGYYITITDYFGGVVSPKYPITLGSPNLSTITASPNTIITVGGGATLSATCSGGTLTWYNGLNAQIGSGASVNITNQLKTEIFSVKCAIGSCVVTQTKRLIVETIIAGADAVYNGSYFEGRGSYNGQCITGVPGSRISISPYTVDAGTYQFSTVYDLVSSNCSQTWNGNFITRKNNVWEIIDGESVSTGPYTPPAVTYTRKYHTKYLFTSNYPPCTAVWIKDADNSEVTLTNSGICENASPIICPTINITSTVASPATITAGQTLILTANGCSGGTITWSTGATSNTISVSPTAASTSYTFVCTQSPCVITSNPFVINVPPPAPTITSSSLSTCTGTSVTLTATGCTGTVTWSTTQTGASISVSPSITTSYTATCTVSGIVSANSLSININVFDGPITSLSSGNWTDAATWSCNCIPASCNDVTVDTGHNVIIPTTLTGRLQNLTVKGSVDMKNTSMMKVK